MDDQATQAPTTYERRKRAYLDKYTVDPEKKLVEAQMHVAGGQFPLAASSLRLILHNDPQHEQANFEFASLFLRNDNPLGALGYMLTAFEANPDNPQYRIVLATIYTAMNCLDAARRTLSGLGPDLPPQVTQSVANIRRQIKSRKQGKNTPVRAKKVDHARIASLSEQYDVTHPIVSHEALAMILTNPRDAALWRHLAVHLSKRTKFIQAESVIRRAMAIDSENAQYYTDLTFIHDAMGEQQFAEAIYMKALDEVSPDTNLIIQYAGLLYRLDKSRLVDAEALLERYYDLGKSDPLYLLCCSQAKDNLSKLDEAQTFIDEAMAAADDDPTPYIQAINMVLNYDDVEQARHILRAGEKRKTDPAVIRAMAGLIASADGDAEATLENLGGLDTGALTLETQIRILFALGRAYDKTGQHENAHAAFSDGNTKRSALMNAKHRYKPETYLASCNEIEKRFTGDWVKGWSSFDVPAVAHKPLAFVFGMPRSGTTLLDTFLRAHPDLFLLEEEPYIGDVVTRLARVHRGLDPIAGMGWNDVEGYRQLYYEKIAEGQADYDPASYVVDRHALNAPMAGTIRRLFPEAKFIFISRHPLDVIWSGFSQDFRLSQSLANYLDLEGAAQLYDHCLRAFHASVEATGSEVHYLRYEDLVADPEGVLKKLIAFLNIEWDDAILDHQRTAKARDRIRTVSHSQVKKPLYQTARYRWKNYRFALEPHIPLVQRWIDWFGYEV